MYRTALLCSALLLATPVSAEVECYKRDALEAALEKNAREQVVEIGIAANNWLIELWMSKGGKTWTLTVTEPGTDRICPLASGTDWMAAPVKLGQAS